MDNNAEEIYEVYWEGPFDKKAFAKQLKRKKAPKAWTLYAMYDDHPLYGKGALTYLGKAVKQPLELRVKQHHWWAEFLYVGTIREFSDWKDSYENWEYKDAIRDAAIVASVEELLIFGLSPAYNQKNKKSANKSFNTRVFNTGNLGVIPAEVSGIYHVEKAPDPISKDKE
jgi:hypothetical protein